MENIITAFLIMFWLWGNTHEMNTQAPFPQGNENKNRRWFFFFFLRAVYTLDEKQRWKEIKLKTVFCLIVKAVALKALGQGSVKGRLLLKRNFISSCHWKNLRKGRENLFGCTNLINYWPVWCSLILELVASKTMRHFQGLKWKP